MTTLITAILLWLTANFDLPATTLHPQIQFARPLELAALRHRGPASDRQGSDTEAIKNTVAIFDEDRRIIYLPEGWTGNTPAELSILVHELVHFLQAVSGAKFECPEARDKTAFEAQERWLALFGKELAREFDIDPFTLLVRTSCPP